MAEISFEKLHPEGHRGGSSGHPSLVDDIKDHKAEVIIGSAAVVATIGVFLKSRSASGAGTATPAAQSGNLATGGSTSVSTDQLASAMQQLSSQEQQDIQSIESQLGSLVNLNGSGSGTGTGNGSGNGPGGGGGGTTTPPPSNTGTGSAGGGTSTTGSGYGNGPSNPPVVTNNPPTLWGTTWLQQNLNAWNSFISGGLVEGAKISPGWAALYVAQNHALPTLDQWNAFLNLNGLRNASTGALNGAAGMPPPTAGQQQIRSTFGYGLGYSNT